MEALIGFLGAIIGAIVGALVAGNYSRQATKDLLDEERKNRDSEKQERVNAILCALNNEMQAVWSHYMDAAGKQLEALGPGAPCRFYFPIIGDYFPIYDGNVGSLGLITDDLLRPQIISTYTLAKSLIDTYRLNNQLIKEWEDATKQIYYSQHTTQTQKVANMKEQALTAYAPALKELHERAKKAVKELKDSLDMWTIK
jgi:gas vesicle protein